MPRWRYVSRGARGERVVAQERHDRDGIVYLTWTAGPLPHSRSLGHGVRNDRGGLDRALVALAVAAAEADATRLRAHTPTGITLGETEARVFHMATGKYPITADRPPSLHVREVRRALRYAVAFFGESRPWAALTRADLRALWRQRLRELHAKGHRGLRGAELLVARVLAIARWLQDEGLLAPDVLLASRHWKRELHDDWRQLTGADRNYVPDRPRYTEAEFRRLLQVAPQVDPRFALLIELGAEQRMQGAARRLMRSDVNIALPEVQLPSSGRKRGALILLTDEQGRVLMDALDRGYLARLERARDLGEIADYPLFPQGRLQGWKYAGGERGADGKRRGQRIVRAGTLVAPLEAAIRPPISRTAIRYWFIEAEERADIPHRPGRGTKALRRTGVDMAVAAGATPAELEAYGGWSDSQMPQSIYRAEQHRGATRGARDIRAKVRKG